RAPRGRPRAPGPGRNAGPYLRPHRPTLRPAYPADWGAAARARALATHLLRGLRRSRRHHGLPLAQPRALAPVDGVRLPAVSPRRTARGGDAGTPGRSEPGRVWARAGAARPSRPPLAAALPRAAACGAVRGRGGARWHAVVLGVAPSTGQP